MLGFERGAVEGDARFTRPPSGDRSAGNGQGVRLAHECSDMSLQLFLALLELFDLPIDGFELSGVVKDFV